MADVMKDFDHLNSLDAGGLAARRQELVGGLDPSKFKDLPDETLQELIAISRVLRKRASAPATKKAVKVTPTLDAL